MLEVLTAPFPALKTTQIKGTPLLFTATLLLNEIFYFFEGQIHLYGGFILHGPHDGYGSSGAPTFSVLLAAEKITGWSIHT